MSDVQNEWVKLSLVGKSRDVDTLAAIMSLIDEGIMIEDYSDITTDGMYGALIDESILNADKTRAAVSVFVSAESNIGELRSYLSERVGARALDASVDTAGMREEVWAEVW